MSSNVPTNEQNAAVGAGSDNDSISSLSSQAANMNLDRSSSPALLSSEASDEEGDITIMKEDSANEEDGPDEEGQMPFLDKHGQVSLPVKRVSLPCCLYTTTHIPTNTLPICLVCLPPLLSVMYHIIMSCVLRLMYPALVKCIPVHSEFFEVPVMCCDEISSCVPSFYIPNWPCSSARPIYSLAHSCLSIIARSPVGRFWQIVLCSSE